MSTARKLNEQLRKQTVGAVLKDVFGKRIKALDATERKLGEKIVQIALGDDYRLFKKCPRSWFKERSSLDFNFLGQHRQLRWNGASHWNYILFDVYSSEEREEGGFITPRSLVNDYGGSSLTIDRAHALSEELEAHFSIVQALEEEAKQLKAEVQAIVKSATTVARLIEAWPLAKKYLPKEAFEEVVVTGLPAILIEQVNDKIAALKAA
jgi:hypothetical protein